MTPSAEVRFWSKVKKGTDSDCWLWAGYHRSKMNYGGFVLNGKQLNAHRASWILTNGDPGSLHVLHRCDNPPCVNPKHLFLGTNLDNIKDRHAKGRTVIDPYAGGASNFKKTHCPHGHPYSKENTHYNRKGHRECRQCRKRWWSCKNVKRIKKNPESSGRTM